VGLACIGCRIMTSHRDSRNPRRRSPRAVLAGIHVTAMLAASPALAQTAAPAGKTATFAIELEAADGVPAWQAEAIARTLALHLAGDRLRPAKRAISSIDRAACGERDRACVLAAYADGGIDIAIRGRLGDERLDHELWLSWPDATPPVRRGVIDLRGLDRARLVDAVRAALHPVLRPGGAFDMHGAQARVSRPAELAGPAISGLALVALVAALIQLTSLALGLLLLGPRGAGALARSRTLLGAVLAAVGFAALAIVDPGPGAGWAVFLAGGVAWGVFAAVTLPILCPPLRGLARVEHGELARVLGAWLALACWRAAHVALFYAPFGAAVWWACLQLDLPALVGLGVVAPVAGLWARQWLRSLVEVLSLRLDRDLVDGDDAGAWDAAVRSYYSGYVRRAGRPADDRALAGVRFLPGRGDAVALYGGGSTHTRLVIGRELLELALAPCGRPHDYALPRVSKLHWTEWNAGLVVPTRRDMPIATREERQPTQTTVEGEIEHAPLGEPRTLAGIVEPAVLDRRVAHRPWEDPTWLDWEPGDEHDGTDAGDKDFLFGVLVRELGRALRHEDRLSTLAAAWRRWPGARLRRAVLGLGRSRSAAVADAHAALNLGRHHLIQYLAYRLWRRDDLLTARAFAPELERRSIDIARAVADPGGRAGTARDRQAPALRRRLAWMAALALPARDGMPAPSRWRRRAALAAAALIAAAALALAALRAIDYHPTYLERARENQRKAERP
jgi:hypothetical protein